uniref:Formin 5 n=1 Tax=Solanum tuberosum TaxID=4113 RepID=M1B575_SOLTU
MGVRGVSQLSVFIIILFTIVAANPVSNRPEDHLLANQISSVGINQELVILSSLADLLLLTA